MATDGSATSAASLVHNTGIPRGGTTEFVSSTSSSSLVGKFMTFVSGPVIGRSSNSRIDESGTVTGKGPE